MTRDREGTGEAAALAVPVAVFLTLPLQQILTIWWLCVVAAVIAVSSTRAARRPAVLHLERRAVWVRSLVGGQLIPQIPRTTLFCISVPNFQSPNTPVLAKMLSSLCLRVRQILTCLPSQKKKNHPQNILWHSCSKRKVTAVVTTNAVVLPKRWGFPAFSPVIALYIHFMIGSPREEPIFFFFLSFLKAFPNVSSS